MICIPIVAQTSLDAQRAVERAEKLADMIEFRLDLLPRESWQALMAGRNRPCIVSLRPERQGGGFRGEETARVRLLEEVLAYRPEFIDLEWDTPPDLFAAMMRKRSGQTGLIVSYHNFEETPGDLAIIAKTIVARGSDVVKIVTHARDLVDNVRVLELLDKKPCRMIAFCMGPFGIPSRILTVRAGGWLTFGALGPGKESAPGQIPGEEMRETYRADRITAETSILGLIGNPVSHSLSPRIQNGAFQSAGIDAVYVPFPVGDLGELPECFERIGVQGFSVTIPHKETIMRMLRDMTPEARAIGAVNTVRRQNGLWQGTNTDAYGAWKALSTVDIDLRNQRWTIIGAGGAARAVVHAVAVNGRAKSLTVVGRSPERLKSFLQDMRGHLDAPLRGTPSGENSLKGVLHETDILVNCTPVGMFPNVGEVPVPVNLLRPRHVVFDTVYNPAETELLKEARNRGCRTISGLHMFIHQAAAQFQWWTGKTAPLSLMEEKARERLDP